MTKQLASRYTAASLGQLSGVGERNVRYYVREGLIDPPTGRGRGAHFNNSHLGQLQRVRILQEAGLDHAAIREYGADIEAALGKRGVSRKSWEAEWAGAGLNVSNLYRRLTAKRHEPEILAVTRIKVAPGIELTFDGTHRLPPPKKLDEAITSIRAAFGVADETDKD
jgi:DNA-binding transcriptional MerR regulator